jgi:hypothetical protein
MTPTALAGRSGHVMHAENKRVGTSVVKPLPTSTKNPNVV